MKVHSLRSFHCFKTCFLKVSENIENSIGVILIKNMYRSSTGSSMRNLAKGSAGLWLQRSPIEFHSSNVEKIAKMDAQRQKEVRQTVVAVKDSESISFESKNEPKKVKANFKECNQL